MGNVVEETQAIAFGLDLLLRRRLWIKDFGQCLLNRKISLELWTAETVVYGEGTHCSS